MKKFYFLTLALICAFVANAAVTYNVTVPTGTKACYIAGEMTGWGQQEMTKVDDTHYTITIANATTSQKYKYCSGPAWDYVEKTASNGDVADRTYSANDVVAKWAKVYNPNVYPEKLWAIGSHGGWAEPKAGAYANYVLTKEAGSTATYTGAVSVSSGDWYFRFAAELSGWESEQYGAAPNNNTNINTTLPYEGSCVPGKGCWLVKGFTGGTVYLTVDLQTKTVKFTMDDPTAIEEVGVDAGEAVYYNLQGVKVANPENGIFIKKQGNKTTKVVL